VAGHKRRETTIGKLPSENNGGSVQAGSSQIMKAISSETICLVKAVASKKG